VPEKMNVTLNVQVVGGPKVFVSLTKEVEAYDKIRVSIDAGAIDRDVDIQPSGQGQVHFLMISLARSEQYGDKVAYKINAGDANTIQLDAPQVFLGKGAVALFGSTALKKLLFSNSLAENASIEILVGRDATS
jgi:hypothetical protein